MTQGTASYTTAKDDYLQENYTLEIDETQAGKSRLNVFVPHVFREYEFGGLSSVLELAKYLSAFYDAVRFVSLFPLPASEDSVAIADYTRGPAKETVSLTSLAGNTPLPCHDGDIFLCSYWPSVFAWDIFAAKLRDKGRKPNPFYYFIQDWEPGFYPMGYKHMLAEATYTFREECVPIFNSIELAKFFKIKNYKFNTGYAIRPALNNALYNILKTMHWELPAKPSNMTTVLIYGRPNQPRNCFNFIIESLERYFSSPDAIEPAHLALLSVGLPHANIPFGNGATLKSLGKLSIHDYAMLLLNSHVGISLMASPHPSYPPLEMATFGLQVITNNYLGKDLNGTHPHIVALPTLSTSRMAEALQEALAKAHQITKSPTKATLPTSLSKDPWLRNFELSHIPILHAKINTPMI